MKGEDGLRREYVEKAYRGLQIIKTVALVSELERTFTLQDTYRKLAHSYERLEATRIGLKYLGYSLVNLRVFVRNPV